MFQSRSHAFSQPFPKSDSVHPQYSRLRSYLQSYESILKDGGWTSLPKQKKSIKHGDRAEIVGLVRKRLALEKYSIPITVKPDSFDCALQNVLECYQKNNGCEISGMIDAQTIATMNISPEKRIEQIKINMQRWCDIPVDTGEKCLLVNVADFNLSLVWKDSVLLEMKTIVGRYYRKTPHIHSVLTQIVLNPEWIIPENILSKDVLPEAKKDPHYLKQHHMNVYRISGGMRVALDSSEIDWRNIQQDNFPYVVVQEPGPDNALGAVKFLFPNNFYVYMHDTPAKDLFKSKEPVFSSGCIRLSNAIGLATQILADEGWSPEKIMNVLNAESNYTIAIKNKLPVYIDYFTSWVDAKGALQFRKDIYNKDHTGQ